MNNSYFKISIIVVILLAACVGAYCLLTKYRKVDSNPVVVTDASTFQEKFHFTVSCPAGTGGYERNGSYVCSDSEDGMWLGQVDVSESTVRNAREVVSIHNAKLAQTDAAYMQVVRETVVDGESALIVKQASGSEAGASSDNLAQTLLVIHGGYLYSVHTREGQKDVDAFFGSFHFMK